MHGLILAGGEGSRLAADGVVTPKALVPVGGRPQLAGLVARFATLGCESITCLVHADVARLVPPLLPSVAAGPGGRAVPVCVVPCRTPSSLHTLVAGLAEVPEGPVFCSMVDTVMAPDDWVRVYAESRAALDGGADAVLAVTPDLGGDDAPLRVQLDDNNAAESGHVVEIGGGGGDRTSSSPAGLITGGVYAFAPAARGRAAALAAAGGARMRVFLADLVGRGAAVRAVVVPRILDVDHRRDLDAANAYAAAWGAAGAAG